MLDGHVLGLAVAGGSNLDALIPRIAETEIDVGLSRVTRTAAPNCLSAKKSDEELDVFVSSAPFIAETLALFAPPSPVF